MSNTTYAPRHKSPAGRKRASVREAAMGGLIVTATVAGTAFGVAAPAHAAGGATPQAAATGSGISVTSKGKTPAAPKLMSGKWLSAGTKNAAAYSAKGSAFNMSLFHAYGFDAHNFVSSNGDLAVCGLNADPAPSTTEVNALAYARYTKQHYVDGAYKNSDGALSAQNLAYVAYVASKFAPDTPVAASEAKQAAIDGSAIDYLSGKLGGDLAHHESPSATVTSRANAMLAEAKKYAGSQTLMVSQPSAPKAGGTSTVTVGAQSDLSGDWVPGEKVTLTLSGGATFDNGTSTTTVTTGTSPVSVTLHNTSTAKATLSASATIAASGLWLQTNPVDKDGKAMKTQQLFALGAPIKLTGSETFTPAATAVKPTVTTKASAVSAKVGDTLYDTVMGKGFPANASVTGTDALYWVPSGTKVTKGQVPSSAKKVAEYKYSAKADAKGSFTAKVGDFKVTQPGDYYWLETANAGSSGNETWSEIPGQFGDTNESTTVPKVKPKAITPTVTTKANQTTGKVGDTLSDTVMGKGFPAGAHVTGTDTLYYTAAGVKVTPGTKPANTIQVAKYNWSATADAKGTFSVKVGNYHVTKAGRYDWQETSNAGSQGDQSWTGTTGTFGDSAESTNVPEAKPNVITPKVTTKANKVSAKIGDTLYDTVRGSGFPANAKVTGTDALYWVPSGTTVTKGVIPASAKKVADYKYSATADAQGNFSVKVGSYKVTKAGDYYWLETANAGTSGGSSWNEIQGQFGDTAESTTVPENKPAPKPSPTPTPKPPVQAPVVPTGGKSASAGEMALDAGVGMAAAGVFGGALLALRRRRKARRNDA